MGIVSVLLFWLPVLGPLIAGYAGGKIAGSVLRGIFAATLPALLAGGGLFFLVTAFDFPLLGALLGGAVVVVSIAHSATLVVGAILGGLMG